MKINYTLMQFQIVGGKNTINDFRTIHSENRTIRTHC